MVEILNNLGKGKRGLVHLVQWKGKLAVLKTEHPKSTAVRRIENEAAWLKRLNTKSIGPLFYDFFQKEGKDQLVMEYVEGIPFEKYLDLASRGQRQSVILDLFHQCRVLDTLKVNKYEMHKPRKHIMVRDDKPVMIDFERCTITLKPKNVTQFAEYLVRLHLPYNKKKLLSALIAYKKTYDLATYKAIISSFSF